MSDVATSGARATKRAPPRHARRHEATLSLRLPIAEKARIETDAEAGGISISEVVRRRYFGRTIKARVDLKVIAQLRQLGGLLKQIAIAQGAASPECRRALSSVADAIDRIAAGDQS